MPRTVTVSDNTFSRLKKLQTPLMGGIETVIDLLASFYERQSGTNLEGYRNSELSLQIAPKEFNPSAPPDLTHTRVLSVELRGRVLPKELAKWNKILDRAILEARSHTGTAEELKRLIVVNAVVGKKGNMGYHYLPEAGVSVQGQDANGAWRATFHIVRTLGWSIDVFFVWANKENLSNGGVTGHFTFGK